MPLHTGDLPLDKAIELSPELVQVVAYDGRIVAANRRWREVLGYSADDVARMRVFDAICEEHRMQCATVFARIVAGEDVGTFEVAFLTRDGRRRTLEVLTLTADSAVDGPVVVCTFRDQTERRELEASLRSSEAQHHLTLEALAEGVLTVDPEDRVTDVNAAAAMLTGCAELDALTRPVTDVCRLVDELTGSAVPSLTAAALALRVPQRPAGDVALLTPDGERAVSVDVAAHPVFGEGGAVAGAVLVLRDVTVQRAAERSLREAHAEMEQKVAERTAASAQVAALLQSAFEASADGIFAVDHRGCVTAANRQLLTMFGIEQLSESIADFGSIAMWANEALVDPEPFLAAFRATFERTDQPHDYVMHLKTGRIVEVISRPQRVGADVVGRVFSCRDVTERREQESHARRQQRLEALGTLSGGVAYDLNNALAPILLVLSSLKDDFPTHREELDILTSSAGRAAAMVRQLLTFARGSSGAPEVLDPRAALADIERMARATFPKNIDIRVDASADAGTFIGDPTQVHQLLLNLCVNARDAMPGGGQLTLAASAREVETADDAYSRPDTDARPGAYVCLSVADTGTGIAPGVLEKMFDPFFTTKAPEQGTGLGLSTTIGLVKGMGGFMRVYSTPQRGSRFEAYFPVGSALPTTLTANAWPAVAFEGRGELVLFVDDEPTVRAVARLVLQRLGLTPLLAEDGTDALMQAFERGQEIAAVVTDLNMPNMHGLRFVKGLRQILPHVPVVVTSGRLDDQTLAEVHGVGVRHTLDKPFTEGELAAVLSAALGEKRAQDAGLASAGSITP